MPAKKRQRPNTICDYDFNAVAIKETDPRVKRRLHGMALLQQGKTFHQVAKVLKVSWVSIRNWLINFENKGLEGLKNKPRTGRKSRLLDIQQVEFVDAIKNLQKQQKGKLKGKQVRRLLLDKFQINYTVDAVYKLLRRLEIPISPEKETKKTMTSATVLSKSSGRSKTTVPMVNNLQLRPGKKKASI